MGYYDNAGATPTKVSWANPQIVPDSQKQSGGWYFNPDSGYVERWWADGDGPGRVSSDPLDNYLSQQRGTLESVIETQQKSIAEYLKNNPFGLDDAWLKATEKQVREEVDLEPYYKEKLSNYIDDVKTTKTRAQEDEGTMLKELERQKNVYMKDEGLQYQQAREQALEGLSGKGLIGQGAGERDLNRMESSREAGLGDYMDRTDLKKQQAQQVTSRLLSDLGRDEQRFTTDLGREKQLQVQSEIQQRKQEELDRQTQGFMKATGQVLPNMSLYTG